MAANQTAGDTAASPDNTAASVPKYLNQFDSLPASAHVNVRAVAAVLGVSVSTVWRMVDREELPAGKKFSQRTTRWNVGELRRAMAV